MATPLKSHAIEAPQRSPGDSSHSSVTDEDAGEGLHLPPTSCPDLRNYTPSH